MKIAHKNKITAEVNTVVNTTIDEDWKLSAKRMEEAGDNHQAIKLYNTVLAKQPHNSYLYDRLMILYRKEKMYRKELSVIETAIKKFTSLLHPRESNHSRKIASLSKSILHSVGLANKKGQPLYQPQPIARWEKRKKTIMKKV